MKQPLDRRGFLAHSMLATAGAALAAGAAAAPSEPARATEAATVPARAAMPTGRIGSLTISRLISGGNLISGWAHARDLHYVPSLMRAYNTEAKVLETLELLETHGVNTIIADPRKKPMDIFKRHWAQGGRMQWIAEGHPGLDDWKSNLQESIDFGAAAVYVQGVIGDRWMKAGRVDLLGDCVDFVKSQGVPGGIGAHEIEVIIESERRGFDADFYVKTLHHRNYWSARRPEQDQDVIDNPADNYWDVDPDRTIAFMAGVEKPWIAFKILAAGAIRPESGFKYALEHGADFLCVGMFDFQVEANARLAKTLIGQPTIRQRPRDWWA